MHINSLGFVVWAALCSGTMFWMQIHAGKVLLPVLGGSPSVWIVCLAFFQVALVVGYCIAHALARISDRRLRLFLHLALLAAGLAGWNAEAPDRSGNPDSPVFFTLSWLTTTKLLPFLALAATTPLIQRWSAERDGRDPYHLYAAGNAASFLVLLAYPFVIEPLWGNGAQGTGIGIALAATLALGAIMPLTSLASKLPIAKAAPRAAFAMGAIALWITLAALPSALLSGVTRLVTTDIAPVPLLWTVPLALYLATWVVAFSGGRAPGNRFLPHAIAFLAGMSLFDSNSTLFLVLHLTVFTTAAYACHAALAALRPPASGLTTFYMAVAIGGALGGIGMALAPAFLPLPIEYLILLPATLPLAAYARRKAGTPDRLGLRLAGLLAAACATVLTLSAWRYAIIDVVAGNPIHIERNFFGTLIVHEGVLPSEGGGIPVRFMRHGTTVHGFRLLDDGDTPLPAAYYGLGSPIGNALAAVADGNPHAVAVAGLGAGTVACHPADERRWSFVEIDPAVANMSTRDDRFGFVSSCAPESTIVVGDGRWDFPTKDGPFAAILMDAFSSDAVPTHLLTREAVAGYMENLTPDGLLVYHISNRHLDLRGVLASAAAENGLSHAHRFERSRPPFLGSSVIVLGRPSSAALATLVGQGWSVVRPAYRAWTDDHAPLADALTWN